MTYTERYNMLLEKLSFEGVVIEPKDGKLYWRILSAILFIVSFGNIKFMETVTTTIGKRIGTPSDWDNYPADVKYEILLHEYTHVCQFTRWGFGNAWLGIIPIGIAYIFLPFPIGLAYFRAELEKEAYTESIRALIQCHGREAAIAHRKFFIDQFTTASYLWMWPFPKAISSWFDSTVARVAREEGV